MQVIYETSQTWRDSLENLGAFPMGLSRGDLESFSLTRKTIKVDGKNEKIFFTLTIKTVNRYKNSFSGNFGWPISVAPDQGSYGYSTGGFISDVPRNVRDVISQKTGIDLELLT